MSTITGWCLLLSAFLAGQVPQPAALQMDLLPGERANIVDLQGGHPVTVAVLGSAERDVQSVDIGSLRLSGAALAKDAEGRTHVLEDVNGDGYLDLVVQFAARQMRLGTRDTAVVLEGKGLDGIPLRGSDEVQTLEAVLAQALPASRADERQPPLQVELESDASGALTVLGSADLDPRAIALGSVRVDGEGIGKGAAGDVVTYEDVNGDGRDDAVLWPQADLKGPVRVEAATKTGRMLVAGPAPAPPAEDAAPSADKSLYPSQININDAAPAAPYPAVIHVSGATGVVSRVRVVINGIIHPCFNDLDVVLVAPTGQSVVLMSDVGGCSGVPNATYLTFDDKATQFLSPGATPTTPSTYRVTNIGAGDPFPAPAPAPSGATTLSAFNGVEPNGAWKLYIVDDTAGNSGAVQRGWSLDLVTMTEVCNLTPLVVPDSGPASAYPSTVTLSGLPPQTIKVTATLKGLTHARPDDLDVMLVAPSSVQATLMSDAGGISPASSLELTFDDDVWGAIPDEAVLQPHAAQPGNYDVQLDPFPAPAPASLSNTDMRTFRGFNPNGTWQLYVVDDAPGSTGTLDGWCLRVTSIVPAEACYPAAISIPASGTSGPASIYPSFAVITGTSGIVRNAEVRLRGLSHTYPDDLDIVLQGPSGREYSLISDAGGSFDVNELDLTIADRVGLPQSPDGSQLGPGPYRMTDWEAEDPLPGGPAPPYFLATVNEPPNGSWQLWIHDDALADVGILAGGYCLSLTLAEQAMYCSDDIGNPPLTIPAGAPGTTSGPATPYPWYVYVPVEGTTVRKVRVHLQSLSHTYPDDLDVMLTGPQGQKTILMSDAGGPTDASGQVLIFDYEADSTIPDSTPFTSGAVYRQQNYEAGDSWPAPAPAGTFSPDLSAYSGTDPFGFWNLWVVDDAGQDVGSMGSWCLEVFPLYPPGEVTNLRWFFDKTQLQWDAAPNATNYTVLRGTQTDLPNLLTADTEGCIPDTAGTGGLQRAFGLNAEPPPGAFYWYLVMALGGVGEYGPAGDVRIGGIESARVVAETNLCGAP